MIKRSAATFALALRALVFAGLFVGPVGAFALSAPQQGASLEGAGLVLFVSLQRAQ